MTEPNSTDQAGLIETCCVCGVDSVDYRNFRDQPFCWPCADCQCAENPCIRTGINDPAVSAEPEPSDPTQCSGEEGFCPEHGFHRHSLKRLALERILADAAFHTDGAAQSNSAETIIAHSSMAHAFELAAAYVKADGKISLRKADVDLATTERSRDQWRNDYTELADRHKRALAQLDNLHQGEEPCPDPLVEPTPAQWLWRWNRATPEQRLDMAGRILQAFGEASRCFMEAHASRVEDGRAAMAALGRVRAELDQWSRTTVMPQTVRALDDIRRALEPPKET